MEAGLAFGFSPERFRLDEKLDLDDAYTGSPPATPERQSKSVAVQVFSVLWRLIVAVAILASAVYYAVGLISEDSDGPVRQGRERSFTVAASLPVAGDFAPTVRSYGEVLARHTIELRAEAGGPVIGMSDNLVDGGEVRSGEVLVRIDSFDYDGALADARSALADAKLQMTVLEEQAALEAGNLEALHRQLELARLDLERSQELAGSGNISDKAIEDRQLLVSQRSQSVAQSMSSIRVQEAGVARQTTVIERAEWAEQEAMRALQSTEIRAPFDGIVVTEAIETGKLVSANEVIASIYQKDAFDVRFILSDRQYSQLGSSKLVGSPIVVGLDLDSGEPTAKGVISRISPEVDSSLGGVQLIARLEGGAEENLRPGAFVELSIAGPTYADSLKVPEGAVYEERLIYTLDEDRMNPVPVEILARDGAFLIVSAEVPEGQKIITTRLAQAGEGVRVEIEGTESSRVAPAARPGADASRGNRPVGESPEPGQGPRTRGGEGQPPGAGDAQ